MKTCGMSRGWKHLPVVYSRAGNFSASDWIWVADGCGILEREPSRLM